ncbi:MAG: 3'-phosphoesterase [Syntrophorhabdus aromaticivorans]|uniref:3'-phosphoesterase n=1 Tax=Syntrophorhabdus aromaticivorans TaxID=328301 RepID=A0A971M5E1_9BACT|nr:3'-phosphoesterase [Syntrophorhabdus aromaticivorans]
MPLFVCHEHHSRRLHYDFRLEIGGTLKSWAIPKGPSLAPKDKRLAVMVPDHPLEYGTFEGIIPQGYYGAGTVVIWDSGDFDLIEYDMEKGRIEFFLKGRKLKGVFVLTRLKGKDKEWLMIKKNDEHADSSFVLRPQLTDARLKTLREAAPPCDTD